MHLSCNRLHASVGSPAFCWATSFYYLTQHAHMSAQSPSVSSKFPEGYGDFAITSGDGVTCHFSRYILCIMSQTFNVMFSIGNKSNRKENATSVDVEEFGTILELFLMYMDP